MQPTEKNLRAALTMSTLSGRIVPVLDPGPKHIDLEDIAHALSMQCRYNGHVRVFYSVAEHSALCAQEAKRLELPLWIQRAALLHDAAEAYVGDMVWPVKESLRDPRTDESNYDVVESLFARAIGARFGLSTGFDSWTQVKQIDQSLCAAEQLQLRTMPPGWEPHVEPAPVIFGCLNPADAKAMFLEAAEHLGLVEVSRG